MNSYIKKAMVLLITSAQISYGFPHFNSILEPLSDVIYVFHGMKTALTCTESGTDMLIWNWQNAIVIIYEASNFKQKLNTTEVVSSVDRVTTTLTDFRNNGSIYIKSTLQFTPSGNFISANVSCNKERRLVKITEINADNITSTNCRESDTEVNCTKEINADNITSTNCRETDTEVNCTKADTINKESTSEATVILQSNSASIIAVVIGSSCAVLLLLVMITISIIILILKKSKVNAKDKGQVRFRDREENNSKDETEYHRINFGHTRQIQEAEFGEYGTLNSGLNNNRAQRYIPAQDEDYSTLNQPHVVNNTWVRDEYEYTSIRIDNSDRNTERKEDSERYAVLERNGEELLNAPNDLGRSFNNVKYSKITTTIHPADLLLNLDTVLIQLREIASKWEALGEFLNFSNETLLEIKTTAKGADFDCLVELFDHWLRCEKSPTWKTIADALKEIGEAELSYEILQIYDTGELPDKKQTLQEQDFENGIFKDEEAPPVPPQCF